MKININKTKTPSIQTSKPETEPKIKLNPSVQDKVQEPEIKQEKEIPKEIVLENPAAPDTKQKVVMTLKANKKLNQEAIDKDLDPISLDDIEFPEDFYEIEGFNSKVFETNMTFLAEKLIKDDRDIKNYLFEIFKNLKQYPELTHLLTNKQIGMIVEGFKQMKQVEIKTTKPKKPTALKQLENVGIKSLLDESAW